MSMFSLIVLSRTDSDSIFKMNQECFDTFIKSAENAEVDYEIILVESQKEAQYNYNLKQLHIITPDASFNFHKFLNIGVTAAKGDYYILSNNDVVYDVNCLAEVLKVQANHKNILSFSPYDKTCNKLPEATIKAEDYVLGYQIQKHLTGWCIITHKTVFNKIKKLDERFNFYYADNDYAMQLIKHNIKHALVTKAKAQHLEGKSASNVKAISEDQLPKRTPKYIITENWTWVLKNRKMIEDLIVFHDKWGSRRSIKIKLYIANILSKIGLEYFNRFIITHS